MLYAFIGAVGLFAASFVIFPLEGAPNYPKMGFDAGLKKIRNMRSQTA